MPFAVVATSHSFWDFKTSLVRTNQDNIIGTHLVVKPPSPSVSVLSFQCYSQGQVGIAFANVQYSGNEA
jgi:hypothetical protein